jgi:hypothetical protein
LYHYAQAECRRLTAENRQLAAAALGKFQQREADGGGASTTIQKMAVRRAEFAAGPTAIAKQGAANESSLELKAASAVADAAIAVGCHAVKKYEPEIASLRAAVQRADMAAAKAIDDAKKTKTETETLKSTLEATKIELAAAVEVNTMSGNHVNTMSGNHLECGICYTEFNHDDSSAARHVFWPCQHARQCGECAIKIWKNKKQSRCCPWCKAKIESRPRPFAPFV